MNNNALTTTEEQTRAPVMMGARGLEIKTLDDAWRLAKYIAVSGLAPKNMDKPEAILVAIQMGAEVGLSAMASIQNIAAINGRPCIWGDSALGLVRASGLLADYSEEPSGEGDNKKYIVTSLRKGMKSPIISTFSVADAKKAGLWGKAGPWTNYPERMLKWRARGFNLRDNFGDVLKGLHIAEEIRDITSEVEVSPVNIVEIEIPKVSEGKNLSKKTEEQKPNEPEKKESEPPIEESKPKKKGLRKLSDPSEFNPGE